MVSSSEPSSPTARPIRRVESFQESSSLPGESLLSTRRRFMPSIIHDLARWSNEESDLESGYTSEPTTPYRRSHYKSSTHLTPQMRSQMLIGDSKPRYRWLVSRFCSFSIVSIRSELILQRNRFYKTDDDLKNMNKKL
jgi:hypothetical protein